MKKILVAVLLTASFVGIAHATCFWTKISEQTGMNGQVICQWKCGYDWNARYTTTSGYGYCPMPR